MFRRGFARLFTYTAPVMGATSQQTLHRTFFNSSWRTYQNISLIPPAVLLNFSLMSFFKKDDEEPEDKLVTTIKRAILSVQREEYEKAERILHMALRMAQDLQSRDGITYVYDSMANLAMERGDFEKAEKLFVSVMQRLFGDGAAEDDMRLLHISAKIAHMAEQSGQLEKAKQGFEWVLKKLEERMKVAADDPHVKELWGMTKNWYAQALMQLNSMRDAKAAFEEAHKVYLEIHGKLEKDGLLLLNNLGVVCTQLGELDVAEGYLTQAVELAKEFPDFVESAVFKANLGLLYLKKGLIKRAAELCSYTWKMGQQNNHAEVLEQSNYCLDQIKAYEERNK